MSMYLLPKTTTEILDKQRRTFFWQGNGSKKKYHLIQWKVICKSKHKGGLGIKDIRKMNISLLSSGGGSWRQMMGCGSQLLRLNICKAII